MKRQNPLHVFVRSALFLTSYIPLTVIIVLKQLLTNSSYLNFGGFSVESILVMLKYFGVSAILASLSIIGAIAVFVFTRNVENTTALDGEKYVITDVANKNSESIGYIATYIVPFLFQDLTTPVEFLTFFILLFVIFQIYINSSLVVVNPVLNIWYSLYEIEATHVGESTRMRCTILNTERFLQEGDSIRMIEIGTKLNFSISEDQRKEIYERID